LGTGGSRKTQNGGAREAVVSSHETNSFSRAASEGSVGAQPFLLCGVELSTQPAGFLFAPRRIYLASKKSHPGSKPGDLCGKPGQFPVEIGDDARNVSEVRTDLWLVGRCNTGNFGSVPVPQSRFGWAARDDDTVDLEAAAALEGARSILFIVVDQFDNGNILVFDAMFLFFTNIYPICQSIMSNTGFYLMRGSGRSWADPGGRERE